MRGSDDAQYVDFNRNVLGRVGDGVPALAQGVRVAGTGASGTFLMGVIGIETIDVGADATALAGPGEPPLGQLMPFVAQNPLGPFIPGNQYQIRSEDEGECPTGALDSHLADLAGASGVAMASYVQPKTQNRPVRGSERAIRAGGESVEHELHGLDHRDAHRRQRREDPLHDRRLDADGCERAVLGAAHVHRDHDPEGDRDQGREGQRDRHVQLHAGDAARGGDRDARRWHDLHNHAVGDA